MSRPALAGKRRRWWPFRFAADTDALHRVADDLEAKARRLAPPVRMYHYPEPSREPFRTTAYVGEPVRELEA